MIEIAIVFWVVLFICAVRLVRAAYRHEQLLKELEKEMEALERKDVR